MKDKRFHKILLALTLVGLIVFVAAPTNAQPPRPSLGSDIEPLFERRFSVESDVMIKDFPKPILEEREHFVFAFMEEGSASSKTRIHVRWSRDALNWQDGNFPALSSSTSVTLDKTHGVGGAARRHDGVFQWLLFSKPSAIEMIWGLGPTIWDSSGKKLESGAMSSAPEAVDLGGDLRLVVFQKQGRVVGKIYDHNSRSFLGLEINLDKGDLNTAVVGRPSITYHRDGKMLIVWRRWTGNKFELVRAIGEVHPLYNLPTFPEQQIGTINLPGTGFRTIDSNPDVTHNKHEFILAVNREQVSTGLLHGWRTLIYESADGVTWALHSETSLLEPVRDNLIDVASRSDGTMVIANLRKMSSGTVIETAARYVRENNTWSWKPLDKSKLWLNKEAAFKQFTLYRYGLDTWVLQR